MLKAITIQEATAMSLTFRPMTSADFPACARELIAAFAIPPWNEVWTYEQAFDRIDGIMSARVSRGWVCMDGDVCVSMLAGRIMTYQDAKLFYIDEFSVRPDHQRQGLGSRMLVHVRATLKQEGISHLSLITERGFPSVAFYEKNGFVELTNELTMAGYVNWP